MEFEAPPTGRARIRVTEALFNVATRDNFTLHYVCSWAHYVGPSNYPKVSPCRAQLTARARFKAADDTARLHVRLCPVRCHKVLMCSLLLCTSDTLGPHTLSHVHHVIRRTTKCRISVPRSTTYLLGGKRRRFGYIYH